MLQDLEILLPQAISTLGKQDCFGQPPERWRVPAPAAETGYCVSLSPAFSEKNAPGTYRYLSNSGEYLDLALKITCNDRKTWQVGDSIS